MSFEITGKVHAVMETQAVSERFSKREFVVEIEDGKYPQLILVQATNDRISHLDGLTVGERVAVVFNLRGREWRSPKGETKYFVSCDLWKIERAGSGRSRGGSHESSGRSTPPPDDGDIPFASCDMAHEPSAIAKVLR